MYKIYDDNNSLRLNLDEFKRFYEAKLEDPNSNVDVNKVSNVYSRSGLQGNATFIPNNQPTSSFRTNTTVTQTNPQPVVTQTYAQGGETRTYSAG